MSTNRSIAKFYCNSSSGYKMLVGGLILAIITSLVGMNIHFFRHANAIELEIPRRENELKTLRKKQRFARHFSRRLNNAQRFQSSIARNLEFGLEHNFSRDRKAWFSLNLLESLPANILALPFRINDAAYCIQTDLPGENEAVVVIYEFLDRANVHFIEWDELTVPIMPELVSFREFPVDLQPSKMIHLKLANWRFARKTIVVELSSDTKSNLPIGEYPRAVEGNRMTTNGRRMMLRQPKDNGVFISDCVLDQNGTWCQFNFPGGSYLTSNSEKEQRFVNANLIIRQKRSK